MTLNKFFSLLIFCFSILSVASAQTVHIEGRAVDKNKRPLYGAYARMLNQSDSTLFYLSPTDTNGRFSFTNPKPGLYTLELTFIGYEKFKQPVTVRSTSMNLGTLSLVESAIPLKEVVIEELSPRATQKNDTTEYTADAFKVNKDANAEELVTKMPGVTVENGTVKAQGENVQQVLVDGKQFFGNDPTLALRNLPAEVIDKIQVFDKMSDQAQFTGFDDGRSVKTMNIVTRQDRRQGQFGKFSAGYGTDSRYVSSGNLSNFSGDMRLSILAMSNNVNQQNFSTQDLLGVMSGGGGGQRGNFGGGMFDRGGRGGGGGGNRGGGMMFGGGGAGNFLMGQQSGTSTVHSLGINYADSLSHSVFASGSYFFNLTNNENPQALERQYTPTEDSSAYYNENSNTERKNYNHRFNARLEYTADTSNSFVVLPQISFQDNNTTNSVLGTNTLSSNQAISKTDYVGETQTNGYSSDNRFTYRHRFETIGRTVSLDFGFGKNNRESESNLLSQSVYYTDSGIRYDSADQRSNASTNGYSLSTNIAYTEPFSATSQLQINYSPSYTNNNSEKTTYDYDPATSGYTSLNTNLSNSYENEYLTHNTGITYRYRIESFNFSVGASYQIAGLKSNQTMPLTTTVEKTFYSILPNLMLNYETPQKSSIRVFYRTSTNAPSISQLQNVVDNSNPLFLSSGNPDLKQSLSHNVFTRLSLSGADNTQSLMGFLSFGTTQDYIANSTFIAQQDTTLYNVPLSRGAQLTIPTNIDGYWNSRAFLSYGFPVALIQSNLNFNAGVSYSNTPGIINDVKNIAKTYALSPGFVLSSNISEDVDYTVSYTANFNRTANTENTELDNSYYTHTAGLRFNWVIWQGIVLRNEVNNSLYNGLTSSLDQNIWLWNISLGKKLFENDKGEITFSVVDLLNQNTSISRTVTETYIEDTQTHPLQRYFLLTFTYNLRDFGRGGEPRRGDGPPPQHGH